MANEQALQAAKRACNELAFAHEYYDTHDTSPAHSFYEGAVETADKKARIAMEAVWTSSASRPDGDDERYWGRQEKVAQAAWLMLLAAVGEDGQADFARSAAELFGRASEL